MFAEAIPPFSNRFNATEFAEWMDKYYFLPEDACKKLVGKSIKKIRMYY